MDFKVYDSTFENVPAKVEEVPNCSPKLISKLEISYAALMMKTYSSLKLPQWAQDKKRGFP